MQYVLTLQYLIWFDFFLALLLVFLDFNQINGLVNNKMRVKLFKYILIIFLLIFCSTNKMHD